MKKIDLLCYTHIYEEGLTCDWEVETDRLCSDLGLVAALLAAERERWSQPGPSYQEVREQLLYLRRKVYDANGSIRGRCAISQADLASLHERYVAYGEYTQDRRRSFVLPGGGPAASQLHVCRCQAKRLVRLLNRHQRETGPVPDALLPWTNLLANHLFVLALTVNQQTQVAELPYTSPNYGPRTLG